jgi:MFS transporter, DHA1 family, multidrug resistance protein
MLDNVFILIGGPVNTFTPRQKKLFLFLIYLTIPLSGFAIDIFTPSLPHMQVAYHTSAHIIKLMIIMYVIGYGFFQLITGAVSDSLGRRKPILWGLFLNIVIAILIPFSPNVTILLILRFLQGFGISLYAVAARAVLSDLYSGPEFKKVVNYLTMVWSLGPIVAPFIGGYIQHYLGWQWNFYFLAAYTAVGFIVIFAFYKETMLLKKPFKITMIFSSYGKMLKSPVFDAALISLGLLYALLLAFNVIGPFLVQVVLHHSAVVFGYASLSMGAAWFLGQTLNRFLLRYHKITIPVALSLSVLASIGSLIIALTCTMNLWLLIIPTWAIVFFAAMVLPNYFASLISMFSETAGAVNALMASGLMMLSGLFTGVASLFEFKTMLPLSIVFIVFSGICLLLYVVAIRKME